MTALLMLIFATLVACGTGDPAIPLRTDGGVADRRPLRIVLIAFDDGTDAAGIADDVTELVNRPADPSLHRIVIRDSDRRRDGLCFAVAGALHRIEEVPATDPMSPEDLARTFRAIEKHFPADREVVLISGHGREWHGIGLRDSDPTVSLTPAALATAFEGAPVPTVERLLVLAGSWTANGETLTPMADRVDAIVAAAAAVGTDGLNLETLQIDIGADTDKLAECFGTALSGVCVAPRSPGEAPAAGAGNGAVVATGPVLANLPATAAAVTAAVDRRATTDPEGLQAELLRTAQARTHPGSCWTTLRDLAAAGDAAVPLALSAVSLYLTDVDAAGVPAGHRPDYRVDPEVTRLAPAFLSIGWAPDHRGKTGFLYRLWYDVGL